MKAEELKAASTQELTSKLDATRQELAELKLKAATSEFKQWHQMRQLRRQIARTLTALRDRALESEENHG